MSKEHKIMWWEIDKPVKGLKTDVVHEIQVQREAIPLVFVPGFMGTCLRRTGTGNGDDGLPNLRWNPSDKWWMAKRFLGRRGAHRKAMLVGKQAFDPNYLEPNDANPRGSGFAALMDAYCTQFLKPLRDSDWGYLGKIFEFPVYAFGYNWTDDVKHSGELLADRIKEIIAEAKEVVGCCDKVILITHSMGGLVSRCASGVAGAEALILGIVHGVQPVTGTPAAYWRMKAGFEGGGTTSSALGNSGTKLTPLFGNIPSALTLLPNKLHLTNDGERGWLVVTEDDWATMTLPASDPYEEIYRVPAVVKPEAGKKPSGNAYWGLIDPNLLDPGHVAPKNANSRDRLDSASLSSDPWKAYLKVLKLAEEFHDTVGLYAHPRTFCVRGVGIATATKVELRVEANWVQTNSYPNLGFRGFFTNPKGKSMRAVLQNPAGDGDGTVATRSAAALDEQTRKQPPGNRAIKVSHQPAYEDAEVQKFTRDAIYALCKMHYDDRRKKK